MDTFVATEIRDCERQIVDLAYFESKLERFKRNAATPEQIAKTDEQLEAIRYGIGRRKTRIKALELYGIDFAARVDGVLADGPIVDPIPPRKIWPPTESARLITFFSINEVSA